MNYYTKSLLEIWICWRGVECRWLVREWESFAFNGWLAISLFCVKKKNIFISQLNYIVFVSNLFVCNSLGNSDSVAAAVVIMTVSFLHSFSFHLVAQIIANCLFHASAYCLLDSDSNLFHRLVPDESTMHWYSPLSSPFQWHCQFFFFLPAIYLTTYKSQHRQIYFATELTSQLTNM